MSLIIVLAVLAVLTGITAWSLRGKTITAPVVVITFAFAGAVAVTAFWLDNRQQDARAHDLCTQRVDTRTDFRNVLIRRDEGLRSLFPDSEAVAQVVDFWRADLDATFPPLNPADC